MLLSLKAGGVGLNLVGGNHLFLIDLHWNPALEQQAFDRVYRMGQEKNVFVHKYICQSTIEERIDQIQQRKLEIAKSTLEGGKSNMGRLTLKDFRYLFELDSKPPGEQQQTSGVSGGARRVPPSHAPRRQEFGGPDISASQTLRARSVHVSHYKEP